MASEEYCKRMVRKKGNSAQRHAGLGAGCLTKSTMGKCLTQLFILQMSSVRLESVGCGILVGTAPPDAGK